MCHKLVTFDMQFSGIYMIINLVDNKFYIGSSINIAKRKSHHLHHLRNNIHRNIHLQRAFNKYGEKYFTFILLEKVNGKSLLETIEQKWMDDLNACVDGYNINPTSQCRRGYKWSEEVKEKISKSHLGIKHSEEAKQKIGQSQQIPILQLTLDGQLIREWNSLTEAQQEGYDKSHISHCCKGKRKSHKGCLWVFKPID